MSFLQPPCLKLAVDTHTDTDMRTSMQSRSRYAYRYAHLYASCHRFASDMFASDMSGMCCPPVGAVSRVTLNTVSVRYTTYTGTLICQLLIETEAQSHRDSSQELQDTATSQGLCDTSKHTYNLYECINHAYEYKGNRKAQDTHYSKTPTISRHPLYQDTHYIV